MSNQKPPGKQPAPARKPREGAAKKAPATKAAAKQPAAKPGAAKSAAAKPAVAKTPAPRAAAGKAAGGRSAAGKGHTDKASTGKPAASKHSPSKAQETQAVAAQPAKPAPASVPAPAPADAHPDLIRVPMAVRWRDLDAFNHVNNSKYLSYLEEARLHWMLGVPGQGMDDHVAPVVAAAQLNYRRPITWPAQVTVELFVERLGNTSLSIGHRIVDDADPAIVYCDGNVVMVWIDRDSGRAAELPAPVREACSGSN